MPLTDDDDMTLTLKVREINTLLALAQEGPWKIANPIINKIMLQGQQQQQLADTAVQMAPAERPERTIPRAVEDGAA